MNGVELRLLNGRLAHITGVSGFHLIGKMESGGQVATQLISSAEAQDPYEFRRIWMQSGGAASDEQGAPLYP